jgi:hypothetical protein
MVCYGLVWFVLAWLGLITFDLLCFGLGWVGLGWVGFINGPIHPFIHACNSIHACMYSRTRPTGYIFIMYQHHAECGPVFAVRRVADYGMAHVHRVEPELWCSVTATRRQSWCGDAEGGSMLCRGHIALIYINIIALTYMNIRHLMPPA